MSNQALLNNRLIELDPNTIQQVRSNYLISSIEQLLEELILNSIDAQATKIDIILTVHSLSQVNVQVSDNGHGIDYEGMKLIGKRYVSSKMNSSLQNITGEGRVFGYRGEALHSIVNLSREVNVTSRTSMSDATCSKHLMSNRSESVVDKTFLSYQGVGTVVTCTDIYSNQPVRKNLLLQALENKSKEAATLNNLRKIVQHICLIHPELTFSFKYNSSNLLAILPPKFEKQQDNAELLIVQFANVMGASNCLNMVSISKQQTENKAVVIEGISTSPLCISSYSRSKNFQFVYLNRRLVPIDDDWIRRTINSEYKKYLQKFRDYIIQANPDSGTNLSILYPNFIFLIDTSDGSNVNRAQEQSSISQVLRSSLVAFFDEYHPLKGMSCDQSLDIVHPDEQVDLQYSSTSKEELSVLCKEPLPKKRRIIPPGPKKSVSELLKQTRTEYVTYGRIAENVVKSQKDSCCIDNVLMPHSLVSTDSEDIRITRSMISSMQVISQLDKKFIVVRLEQESIRCICLIDQHAADERIRLEELETDTIQQQVTSDGIAESIPGREVKRVVLGKAVIVAEAESNPKLIQQIIDFEQALNKWYWKIDVCGGNEDAIPGTQYEKAFLVLKGKQTDKRVALLKTCPSVLGENLSIDDLKDFLNVLSEFESPSIVPSGIYRVINYKACRSAIMFGDYLERLECENIVQKLSVCRLPFQCAHGRPSMTILFKYA